MISPGNQIMELSKKTEYEVADIFRLHKDSYLENNVLTPVQSKVMGSILSCRTATLGGHIDECDNCGLIRVSYNSCRDRHCPKCQSMSGEKWIEARKSDLLPLGYFHNVFTLAHELNDLVDGNERIIYDILFKSATETLQEFAKNELGGLLGITAVLHTWSQLLNRHIHLHCIVTGGALSLDASKWISLRYEYLFPVLALSEVFRGKYCDMLEKANNNGELKLFGKTNKLKSKCQFKEFIKEQKEKDWVVFSKEPFGNPENVLRYLGRYTHRVAISNRRILSISCNEVRYSYKDNLDDGKVKEMTISCHEFIKRFLLHVLPSGFMKIRHYGILGGSKKKLKICKKLLAVEKTESENIVKESYEEMLLRLTGEDIRVCPCCGIGKMKRKEVLSPNKASPFKTREQYIKVA